MNRNFVGAMALWLIGAAAGDAWAGAQWDETVNGDLSNDSLVPTVLSITFGSNTVVGTTGNAGAGIDRDFFSFVVPTGARVTAATLLEGTEISGSASFIAIKAASRIVGDGPASVDGFMHYDLGMIGLNLLPQLGFPDGLSEGTYTLWLQETGGTVRYGLDLAVTATPVPIPAVSPLLTGLLILPVLGRRRRVNSAK